MSSAPALPVTSERLTWFREEVFTAGGMPPLVRNPDEVYRRTYKKVESRNVVYYEKYPQDIANVKSILRHLSASEVVLPSGGILTSRRFMGLGLGFGGHGLARPELVLNRVWVADMDEIGERRH